jgi:hypothetical protein
MSSTATVATQKTKSPSPTGPVVHRVPEHTVEIVSDSGEGAQKCGQAFGMVSAKMGNGVWTVEIIPAEIQPPPRLPAGASGNRIRIGTRPVTNWGDAANLVVAFTSRPSSRGRLEALHDDAVILVENRWAPTTKDIRRRRVEVMETVAPLPDHRSSMGRAVPHDHRQPAAREEHVRAGRFLHLRPDVG